jgi:methyl-accepting chemotaxis protein
MIMVYVQVKKSSMEDISERLNSASNLGYALLDKQYPGEWRVDGTNLYKGDCLINNDPIFVDLMKKYTGYPATIFLGDTRIATNVTKEDGNRAVGTKVSEIVSEKVLKGGATYEGEATILGNIYQAKYIPIKDQTGKVIGIWFIGVEKSAITAKLNNIMFVIIGIALAFLTLAIIVVILFANLMKKNINSISSSLNHVSNGNLQNESTVKSRDEFGEISKYINTMISNLKEIIQKLQNSSNLVSSSSGDLSSTSTEMTSVTKNIASSIQEVAEGTGMQASEMVNITSILNEFSDELDLIASRINNINDTSMLINNMASESNDNMKTLISSMETVKTSFDDFGHKFDDLSVNLDKVNEITSLIDSISDRTNLLSLNASIEAARAGESGRGFTIVADEIRKLAEQSKVSSQDINSIVKNVITENRMIMQSTVLMKTEVETQTNVIQSTINTFKNILSLINELIPKIESANKAVVSVHENKNSIVEKIESTSAVAQEISASTQEVAAASEELNTSAEKISATAERLNSMTKELVAISNKFEL